ncbi:hypothetical protein [uncultured Treponema sp.]|uniref:hypothetical protein n=1 Tax=uncultured Treponema sp. TaxID=162155 RepID=UPI002628FD66|nr:hypothetical protein [uncultured Treponema sp.]
MNEILGKIVDKGESLTNNPRVVFNYLEIYYLLDIVSVIVFKKNICSFVEEGFSLIFKPEYFLFISVFLLLLFTLYFISSMARVFLSKLFIDVTIKIDDFFHKDRHGALWSIYFLEKFARENNKTSLYEKLCEQQKKSVNLSKQLDFNFLLGVTFFIHIAVCRSLVSNYLSAFIYNIRVDNHCCYLLFVSLQFFIMVIILLYFLHSFLSLSEYYVEHIESPEYDNFIKEKN